MTFDILSHNSFFSAGKKALLAQDSILPRQRLSSRQFAKAHPALPGRPQPMQENHHVQVHQPPRRHRRRQPRWLRRQDRPEAVHHPRDHRLRGGSDHQPVQQRRPPPDRSPHGWRVGGGHPDPELHHGEGAGQRPASRSPVPGRLPAPAQRASAGHEPDGRRSSPHPGRGLLEPGQQGHRDGDPLGLRLPGRLRPAPVKREHAPGAHHAPGQRCDPAAVPGRPDAEHSEHFGEVPLHQPDPGCERLAVRGSRRSDDRAAAAHHRLERGFVLDGGDRAGHPAGSVDPVRPAAVEAMKSPGPPKYIGGPGQTCDRMSSHLTHMNWLI